MLYLLDLDGTVISSYMDNPDRDFHTWHILPGRAEAIKRWQARGDRVAIITNQAGVASGFIKERDVVTKISQVLDNLGLDGFLDDREFDGGRPGISGHLVFGRDPETSVRLFGKTMHRAFAYQANPGLSTWMTIHVCYAQNRAKDVFYQVPQEVQRRKPSPDMIFEALDAHGTEFSQAFMIGDMDSDREAAERAGITYYDAEQFDWSL